MKGGKNREPLGYTIIEVIIVLAISGVMFLIAATFISGKQEQASFTSGVNQMASQVQDVIEQITDGKYSDIPLGCLFNGSPPITFPNATTGQGTNSSCVFLGKVMTFSQGSSAYTISSLAGGRNVNDPSLSNVDPTVIPSLDTSLAVPEGLQVTAIQITDSNGTTTHSNYYNFGFIQGLGTSVAGGTFQSGSQTISMVYSPQTSEIAYNNSFNYADAVSLCLSDGKQTAKLVLGGANDSQLNVDVQHLGQGASCP